jgi:hypothetical protein
MAWIDPLDLFFQTLPPGDWNRESDSALLPERLPVNKLIPQFIFSLAWCKLHGTTV